MDDETKARRGKSRPVVPAAGRGHCHNAVPVAIPRVVAHPPDQRPQVRIDLRPTSKGAGLPTPVPAEAGTMPANEGLGPNDFMALRTDGNQQYSWTKKQADRWS